MLPTSALFDRSGLRGFGMSLAVPACSNEIALCDSKASAIFSGAGQLVKNGDPDPTSGGCTRM
jgi:hypothetical protein